MGPCGDCRRVLWVPGPRVSIRGKFVLSRNPEYKTRGGHHVAKRSSDPRVAYPEVKVQVRDLVRVLGTRGSVFRGNASYRTPGEYGRRRPQAAVRHGRARQSSRTGPCGDSVCTWPAGSVFGENSF